MLAASSAIVLRAVPYGDRSTVLKCWTSDHGVRGYLVRQSRRSGATAAALRPLTRLELVADERGERDLRAVREMRIAQPFARIPFEPIRGAVALFVQEVLVRVLREESGDTALDAFLHEALEALDSQADLRGFPHAFLMGLSQHLGFMPEPPEDGHAHFDLKDGRFVPPGAAHGHLLAPPLSTALGGLVGEGLEGRSAASLPSLQRRDLLDHILLFYRFHIDGLGELHSPEVLHAALS
jgi:DNA repair protein RecO (recombination protein O)